jgi:hypothetical protein
LRDVAEAPGRGRRRACGRVDSARSRSRWRVRARVWACFIRLPSRGWLKGAAEQRTAGYADELRWERAYSIIKERRRRAGKADPYRLWSDAERMLTQQPVFSIPQCRILHSAQYPRSREAATSHRWSHNELASTPAAIRSLAGRRPGSAGLYTLVGDQPCGERGARWMIEDRRALIVSTERGVLRRSGAGAELQRMARVRTGRTSSRTTKKPAQSCAGSPRRSRSARDPGVLLRGRSAATLSNLPDPLPQSVEVKTQLRLRVGG